MKTPAATWLRAAVPMWPWVAEAGRAALPYGIYVYQADHFGITLAASNGSLAGQPLMRYWIYVHRETIETFADVAAYAASVIRERVDAGLVMLPLQS